jgi:hypothetical protein
MTFVAVLDPNWSRDAGGGGRGAQEHYALNTVSKIAEGYYGARDDGGRRIWPQLNTRDPMLVFMWATEGAMHQPDDLPEAAAQPPLIEDPDTFRPPDAFVLARLLGLRVVCSFPWVKVDDLTEPVRDVLDGALNNEASGRGVVRLIDAVDEHDGTGVFAPRARMGIGQWSRKDHEHLLLCKRGSVPVPGTESRPRSVIYAPVGEHSEKPDKAWTQVIEPIARASAPGSIGIEFNCRSQRPGWAAFGALDGEHAPLRYAPCVSNS